VTWKEWDRAKEMLEKIQSGKRISRAELIEIIELLLKDFYARGQE
jgi:hypothetical protein